MIYTTHPRLPISKKELVVGPRFFALFLLAVFLIAMVVNFGFAVNHIVRAPKLTLESPRDGEVLRDPLLEVRGKTETGAQLILNGQAIVTSADGEFRELLSLQQGLNAVRLSARKRYSRTREVTLQVLYEPSKELTLK